MKTLAASDSSFKLLVAIRSQLRTAKQAVLTDCWYSRQLRQNLCTTVLDSYWLDSWLDESGPESSMESVPLIKPCCRNLPIVILYVQKSNLAILTKLGYCCHFYLKQDLLHCPLELVHLFAVRKTLFAPC